MPLEETRKSGTPSQRDVRFHGWRIVAFTALTWFFLQTVHQFLPAIYAKSIETLSVGPSAALVLLFLAPLAYLVLGGANPSRLVVPLGLAVVVLRTALAFPISPDAILLFGGLTVAAYMLYLPAHLLRAGAAMAGIDAVGFALAFAADATARAVYLGSDPFTSPWGFIGVAAVAGVASFALLRDHRGAEATVLRPWEHLFGRDVVRTVLVGLGFGAVLALQTTLLGYPSVLARFVAASYPAMTLAVLAGAGAGIVVVARGFQPSPGIFLVGNAIVVGAVIDLVWAASPALPVLVAIAEFAITLDLALMFRYLHRGPSGLSAAGLAFGVAGLVFVLLVFVFVLTLAYAFVPARSLWEGRLPLFLSATAVLAVIAAILIASRSRRHGIRIEAAPPQTSRALSGAVVILVLTASLSSLVSSTPTAGSPSSIVVMTYNIHQGFGQDGRLGIERIAEVIRQANADIVALQESDVARISSGNQDAVRFLARSLGYHEAYGPPTRDQIFGVSILSRFPILRWNVIALPSTEVQRVMVEADVQVGAQVLRIYATHFGLPLAERLVQTEFLREFTASAPSPRILLGDLNSPPLEEYPGGAFSDIVYAQLTGDWRDAWTAGGHPFGDGSGGTFPSRSPIWRVDYVFVGPGISVNLAEVPRSELTTVASDHLPLIVRLQLS